jgi:NADH-quinone oxidoreductase subunit K
MTRKHFIVTLMAFELIFLSISLNFIVFSFINDGIMGQAFAVFIMTVAASESAIGLAILVIYYRLKGDISVDFVSTLKG